MKYNFGMDFYLPPRTPTRRATRLPLPPDTLAVRDGVGMMAQPLLRREQAVCGFQFFDATLLLVRSGTLTLDIGATQQLLDAPLTLLAVAQHTRADVRKTPGGEERVFRSTFLALPPEVILEFYKQYESETARSSPLSSTQRLDLDTQLADTLDYCVRGMLAAQVSDREQRHRLIGLLLALAERGCVFPRPSVLQIGDRLKGLLSPAPQRRWTTAMAAHELAMSEATLRRRLASENLRFETLLLDIRMHHAMTLLQTTAWSIPQIAEASGYQASSRFSSRFRERFGCPPSRAR
ncbi:AraC family transcriptional regulator [Massilia sp. NR 4-1]|uniref:AraC family transcriptional regulator n=1 Tax=Massilia sp. NR 4-1 TaxID=1678028 RepID=UPI00123710E5|nr:AraC family transcriptional regulator [Massilia sp. NR 4-1]